jgi:putative Holliday junction resolvase
MDGTEGPKAKEARKIGELIKGAISVDLELIDEGLTTFQAIRELHKGKGKVGKSREKINMMAAILILQGYLDSLPAETKGES